MLKHARRSTLLTAVIVALALTSPPATQARADFVLWGHEELRVAGAHDNGWLYDWSRAIILSWGSVLHLDAYDTSTADISGGRVEHLDAYDTSTADISGGSVYHLYAYESSAVDLSAGSVSYLSTYDNSAVDLSGGSVYSLRAYDSSTADISGGSVAYLYAYESSAVDMSGGSVSADLIAYDTSTVDLSGGSLHYLCASDSSTADLSGGSVEYLCAVGRSVVTFRARDFHLGEGLSLDGDRVLGTGGLSGEWFDGTRWGVNIGANASGATILAIPEPGMLLLLALGGLAVLRRRG